MENLIVSTPSQFREYIFQDLISSNDLIVYENKKDFKVTYKTEFLENQIQNIIKKYFSTTNPNLLYEYIDNINSNEFKKLLERIDKANRLIMSGANFLREKQYLEVSNRIKTILNIHIGDPNLFRGLDSNLWALLDDPNSSPVVTLHHANLSLDKGKILFQIKSDLSFNDMTLEELVKFEIEGAKECMKRAILIKEVTQFESDESNKGLYKSAMSSEQKHLAFNNLKSI